MERMRFKCKLQHPQHLLTVLTSTDLKSTGNHNSEKYILHNKENNAKTK